MAETILRVEGLRIDYDDVTAVSDVSFTIERGMVFGLIGPNGAGKTSIIRAIATLLTPTWGSIRLGDVDLVDAPLMGVHRLGFMPDFPPLYDDLTVQEMLELFASAYNLPAERRADRIDQLIETVDLTQKKNSRCGDLSRGMKQRLFLAKTLLHDPDLLLLDEPASGLDPKARLELKDILVGLGEQGKAVLVSSHILAEMTDFCNSVGIIEAGRMKVSGRVDEILAQMNPGMGIVLGLAAPHPGLGPFLAGWVGVSHVETDGKTTRLRLAGGDAEAAALLKGLIDHGLPVTDFHRPVGTLQDIFMQVSTGRVS